MNKLYRTGLIIGRFQTVHRGHEFMIRRALELCDQVIIYIGSAQESGTKNNPFSFEIRFQMLYNIFKDEFNTGKIVISPLDDIGAGNSVNWGKYVLDCVENDYRCQPDLYVTGCEKDRSSWFTNDIAPHMDELRLTRHNYEMSASDCRKALLEDDVSTWLALVPERLHPMYKQLREILLEVNNE